MSEERLDFTGVADDDVTWTLLGTLYLRAWESGAPRPILGDHHAAEAIRRIDYDFAKLHRRVRPEANQYLVALRATQFDDWAVDFLRRHPDAVVLHLGCGLDSRALRLVPPSTVDWFDLDQPEVIELRRKLYPEREHYRLIGSSVTDPSWLAGIPADRPALVIAEGLLPYLGEAEVRQLLQRLVTHFGSGELHFDAGARWLAKLSPLGAWGLRDAREVERWHPRLRCLEEVAFTARYARIPSPAYRRLYQVMNAIPFCRNIFREYRFSF
ncbi:class I SAM-dependent methyltransferase [Crossiella sp. CA-258035]|uniref:class I SAM-dependent methyltransferase n=1 Tax=Crossiella sp. CA-258035 TaxID=2981138 RepID=UPI0024BC63C4|nr:class I SAM-dependent methyltransferase [Crossiella sp. CA-258035]WHT16965.1 class I SAM-dependent methyltransferase [Crossiella sp. CA-258035]